MKHLFPNQEELQQAHEQLAYVEYLYANRTQISQFICINLQSYGYGNFEGQKDDEDDNQLRMHVSQVLRGEVEERIYPYSTVEAFIANRDGLAEPNDTDREVAHQFRADLLATMLAELA